jgi:hypothetical protein
MAIGSVTLTTPLVLTGESSPKSMVKLRSEMSDVFPVTDPPTAPDMVGVPPDEMSRACAIADVRLPSESIKIKMNR